MPQQLERVRRDQRVGGAQVQQEQRVCYRVTRQDIPGAIQRWCFIITSYIYCAFFSLYLVLQMIMYK